MQVDSILVWLDRAHLRAVEPRALLNRRLHEALYDLERIAHMSRVRKPQSREELTAESSAAARFGARSDLALDRRQELTGRRFSDNPKPPMARACT